MVTMYGTHCPMCNQLEKRLTDKAIEFTMVDDAQAVLAFGRAHKIMTAPILDVDGQVMTYKAAMEWAKEQNN